MSVLTTCEWCDELINDGIGTPIGRLCMNCFLEYEHEKEEKYDNNEP